MTVTSEDLIEIQVPLRGGGTTTLSTRDHAAEDASGDAPTLVPGREWEIGFLFDSTASSFTIVRGAINHAGSSDLTDWMAIGWWMSGTGNLDAGSVSRIYVGAFVDGPEFRASPSLPDSGTADYEGVAVGVFTADYDASEAPESSVDREIGEYRGRFTVTADFGSEMVMTGTVDEIEVTAEAIDANGQYLGSVERRLLDTSLTFSNATIDPDEGTFAAGTSIEMGNDAPYSIMTSSGSWGGRLSSETESGSSTVPRALAGTHGVEAETTGGTEFSFIGAHLGATASF